MASQFPQPKTIDLDLIRRIAADQLGHSQPIAPIETEQPVYLQNAIKLAALGIPIELFQASTKACIVENWETSCTTDVAEIIRRAEARPDHKNIALVAKAVPGGFCFLDDDGGIRAAFEVDGGKMLPTRRHKSCSDNFHYIYKHSPKSLDFWEEIKKKANISETKPEGGEMWSLRMHNSYIVGPGSTAVNHSGALAEYKTVNNLEIIEIPDDLLEFLIDRWRGVQGRNKTGPDAVVSTEFRNPKLDNPKQKAAEIKRLCQGDPIPYGSHDTVLTSVGGALRHFGLEKDDIEIALIETCEKRCVNHGTDHRSMCRKIAASVSKYAVGKYLPITVGGQVPSSQAVGTIAVSQPITPEIDQTSLTPRPVFPIWAIRETTLYENFVQPVVESSSKNPEFLWLPGVQLMMNYLSDRVQIESQSLNWNLFLGLISDPGKYFKSSSCKLAQQYFELMGLAQTYTSATRNAEGRVIVMQAGSSEGFGLAMHRIVANHAIMFNDELGKLVAKIGIENSAMSQDILSWYERDYFGNTTSNQKIKFGFPADTYTFGMCWCTTTRGFGRHWPKLAGIVSGMEDRMFFCVGPEKPRQLVPLAGVSSLQAGSVETRKVIDAAVAKGVLRYEDITEAREVMSHWSDPRSQGIVEKFAAYFCIDLKRDVIDSECIERAGALCDFRNATIAHLAPIEADNQIGRIQQEMVRELRRNGGKLTYREFFQNLQGSRLGIPLWKQCYNTMIDEGLLVKFKEPGKRGQTRHMVGIPKLEDED